MTSPLLVVSNEKASGDIDKQIEKGEELRRRSINTPEQLQHVEDEHSRWTERNIELMARVFDTDAYARKFWKYRGGISSEMSMGEHLDYLRNVTREQVNDLRAMRDRLDLIPTKEVGGQAIGRRVKDAGRGDEKVEFDKASIMWWLHNLPASYLWGGLSIVAGLIFGAFVSGVYAGHTTFVKELIGKNVEQSKELRPMPPEIKIKIDQLTEAHALNIEKLRTAIIEEERQSGAEIIGSSEHRRVADSLKKELKEENETFANHLKLLQSLSTQEK
jgi:hypothetical protein